MEAEIIAIGDELTSGQRLDTNSQWLAQRLGEIGVRVLFHTTVADELPAGEQVFRQALDRADLVVATGGLGPTADDLTRESIAAATGTSWNWIRPRWITSAACSRAPTRRCPSGTRSRPCFPGAAA